MAAREWEDHRMSRRSHHRGRAKALLSLLTAVLATLGVFAAPAAADPAPDTAAKIEQSVQKAFASNQDTDFWVMFRDSADLSRAAALGDWNARGVAVVKALRDTADRSQAEVRTQLDAQKINFQSYYIVNAIRVHNGSGDLANSLARRGDVTSILSPRTFQVPAPVATRSETKAIQSVEWGLQAIHADQVWSTFGVRGEGITVANVDSGVDYTHPALVGKYRGNQGNGSFDHNYSWFDPANVCPTAAPCDNNDHGTHTMGTMVGDDGAGNQIGVAPNARWIAAKGCESNSCSDTSLLASGQWILAPTDLSNANPRPDLRPNIVNNSWGEANGGAVNPFYKATVQAWHAAGIFVSFSNGNAGPGCNTSGSPGDYNDNFASGAFDINGNIASFSSRGPGENGVVKPNLSAPGVNVRSSVPGGYDNFDGTSMASPHTAGTVALMWSAAPALVGDVTQTESILKQTAVDTSDLTCGGTPENNNVWGEGKLNALAAVDQSPRAGTGRLTGTVTDSATGNPISGAAVHVAGPLNRDSITAADGTYSFVLSAGSYTVTTSAFGYNNGTASATVTADQTTTANVAMTRATSGTVSGHVRDAQGAFVGNIRVELVGTPIPAVTSAADGSYSIPNVPLGTYQAKASGGGCFDSQTQALTVTGDVTLDFTVPNRRDTFGHFCVLETGNYVEGDTPLALTGDDASTSVTLPFEAFFYGRTYTTANIATNGHINFLAPNTAFNNGAIPTTGTPNAAIYGFWDDLIIDSSSVMRTKVSGTAPNREFLVEWRNATFFLAPATQRFDFEVVLSERGDISLRYRNIDPADGRESGNSATVGIENHAGTDALQYSLNSPTLSDSTSIRFKVPANGTVAGTVTDFNDGQAVAGATVKVLSGTTEVSSTTTAADGSYRLRLIAGQYTVEVSKSLYATVSNAVTIGDGTLSANNVALHTPRAELTGGPLSFLAQAGQLRTATLNLASTSDLDLNYSLTSSASWLWTVPGSVTVPHGTTQPLTVRVDPVGLAPGAVYHATIDLTTNAGRSPSLSVPVTLVVPGYRKGVDAGATGAFTDGNADAWVPDQAWSAGGFGYIGPGFVETTTRAIAGTTDDQLYQSQRSGLAAYRFDNLPAGTYTVELDFAELRASAPGKRVFDVSINGTTVLPGYDVTAAVGALAADRKTFNVTVPANGTIEVFFGARKGKQPPIINSLRVTHRPDL
jgi:subtilisin family serine protease